MRIAVWSGPRNLSTALMYSFGARNDCAISDEPFYAAYLNATGIQHPMQEEILSNQEQNPNTVAKNCIGPNPENKDYWYQKHMCQHMIEGFPLEWAKECKNIFLIRHPARVIASYSIKREDPIMSDIGFVQQYNLYKKLGGIVIDSNDIRKNPEQSLQRLCEAINIPFSKQMLNWPSGGHKSDGIWAKHWYGSIWKSTKFSGAEGEIPELYDKMKKLSKEAYPYYDELKKHCI